MKHEKFEISININDKNYTDEVEPRLLLADFIRHSAGLTGTHIGCEHGVCGACTVSVDGVTTRSCLMFAVQANNKNVRTIEDNKSVPLKLLKEEFHNAHALQCGYCTPGILFAMEEFIADGDKKSQADVTTALDANLCRCTGYINIAKAVEKASCRFSSES